MAYELEEKRNLCKYLGILSFLGTGAMTGSPQAASTVKEKVEKVIGLFDDEQDKNTISGIVETIVGKSWEEACEGYGLSSECRQELAQYNIMSSIDDWDSIATIRFNIIRICKKNNVRLNTVDPGDIARKLLNGIVSRVNNNPVLTERSALRELLSDTTEIKQKLDEIMYTLNAGKGNDPELYGRLMERFLLYSSEHPSIKMMTPDPSLFPRGLPVITSSERIAKVGTSAPYPIKDMILRSWKEADRKHILLVGEGGIGKTVAMLTLPSEEWIRPYRIPAIYVPLQVLKNYEGRLNEYIERSYRNDMPGIDELANSAWTTHPNLLLLLDGFNEIPDQYKNAAVDSIEEWMKKPGVQVVTTSRISLSLDAQFQEYKLQPIPKEVVRNYLLDSGIRKEDLPGDYDHIWSVINIPLMMTIYTQIDKVKERTKSDRSSYLDWKESDNAAHIIWNYLQSEIYRLINSDKDSRILSSVALLAVAPYICYEMVRDLRFRVERDQFVEAIRKALHIFESDKFALPGQIYNIQTRFDKYKNEKPFQEEKWEDYLRILTEQSALFQEIEDKDKEGNIVFYCVPAHQNFRDALAAIYISTCTLNVSGTSASSFPIENVLDCADQYVKNYIAEFLSNEEIMKVWNYHRKTRPENGRLTWILLDIIGRQRDYDYSEIDFSGLDLTRTNLYRLFSRRPDICPLPQKAEFFKGTKLSFASLLPEGHSSKVSSVSYSPDGRHLASGSTDGTVRIWDLESGECRLLENPTGTVESISYSPDGMYVASGSTDGIVRIWNLENGESRPLEGHTGTVKSVSYSPDGRHVASGSSDGIVRIWDLESGESRPFEGHIDTIESVSYSPDGRYVASGSTDGTVRIWDLRKGENRVLVGHTGSVTSISYSREGRYVASGSWDRTVRIWDLESGEVRILEGHSDWVTSVSCSSDGRYLASSSNDCTVRIWDLDSGESRVLGNHICRVESVSYSPDDRYVASGSLDKTVRIWELESGDSRVLESHKDWITSVAFSPDGKYVASGSFDGIVVIWNLESGERVVLKGYSSTVIDVAYSPDGRFLSNNLEDGSVLIWNLRSSESIVLKGDIDWENSIAYSADGRYWAKRLRDGAVRILDLENKESCTLIGRSYEEENEAYSPCGSYSVGGFFDGTVQIWDLEGGEILILKGHTGPVKSVAYSPNGRCVVSGSEDGTVRIWHSDTGQLIRCFRSIYNIDLYHVNFELAEMLNQDRQKFKECGAFV